MREWAKRDAAMLEKGGFKATLWLTQGGRCWVVFDALVEVAGIRTHLHWH
jgi:hypothetical protein